MKVGVYNQFLLTMGGGERHMGMAAEVLARAGHDVELITHVPASVDALAARFDLDLPGVRLRTTPLLPFDQLGDLTAKYDLWVNASFMSMVPSRAPRSLLLVLFPFPLDETPFGRFKRRLARHIHRELYVPRYGEGFFGPQELGGSRYRWTAGRGQVTLEVPAVAGGLGAPGGARWRRPLPLRIVLGSFRPAGWGPVPVTISVGKTELRRTAVETTPGDYVTLDLDVPPELIQDGQVTLRIESPVYRPYEVGGASGEPEDFREVGVAVARVMVRHPRHYLYEALFERAVPELGRRLHGLPDERARDYLQTYDVICPISRFSDEWLSRYWGQRGEILYPPVDVAQYAPRAERKPVILGVGRFFRGEGHAKRHDAMIRTFRRLVEEGLSGWELHLAGGSMAAGQHQRYLRECRRLAEGLPVTFHVDASLAELKGLYESATVYWHAAGLGESETRNPIKCEHFGITVVEAMAAGCVPVVLGKGGVPEIVEHGESGFHWRSETEWRRYTLAVATDPVLAARLRAGAMARSTRFGEDVFRDHLLAIVQRLEAGPA
jgi:glycosyltransferase involved in cell wall biosynthesis